MFSNLLSPVLHVRSGYGRTWVRILPAAVLLSLLASSLLLATQSRPPAEIFRDAAQAYERGDLERAISLYQELLKLQPESVQIHTNLGVALAHANRYSEAIAQYQEALKFDPDNTMIRLNLAIAWYKQADCEKASAELETVHRQQPDHAQALYLLADCYLRLGKNREAVTLLEPAYQAHPDDRVIVYTLGTALIRDGQAQKGAVIIDRILKDGNTAEANLLMGAAQSAAGDYKGATSSVRKALDLNPSLPGAWSLYGRVLLDAGENENAKTAFRRALVADANDFDANLYLGGTLRHDGSPAEAAPYIERAAQLRPASAAARFQVGMLDLALGKLDDACKRLEQVERDWPDFQEAHVQLALLYSRLNRAEDSRRERELVLKLNEKAREKKSETGP